MALFPRFARLFMQDGMCLVRYQRPETVERGDFDEGTSHLALEISSEDFDKATDDLKKAGVKVIIDKPVVRPRASIFSIRNKITYSSGRSRSGVLRPRFSG